VTPRLLSVFAALVLAGCASPSPTPAATDSSGGREEPRLRAEGEDEHVRVAVVDHEVRGVLVNLTLDVTNKDPTGRKLFSYVWLDTAKGLVYVDFPGELQGNATKRFRLSDTDPEARPASPWLNLTIFYKEDIGREYTDDEAVVIPLQGKGLPRRAS
jgi:hypothetical protein